MPIDLTEREDGDSVDISPDTNRARIIKLLYSNRDLGWKPNEIRDELDIPEGSVSGTLSRMIRNGEVARTSDGFYHAIADRDDLYRFARGLRELDSMFEHTEGADDVQPNAQWESTWTAQERAEYLESVKDVKRQQYEEDPVDVDDWVSAEETDDDGDESEKQDSS
jgi:hypothetical protein